MERDDGEQYIYCYISSCCESQEELETDFRRKHEFLVNATPTTDIGFMELTGTSVDEAGSSDCPFS